MKRFSLEGKTALVTGGSQGIGFALAEALAEAGAKIAYNATSPESVEKGAAEYDKAGLSAKGYVCDVSDEKAVREMIVQIEKDLGKVDILVNNAGIIKRIPALEMSVEDFKRVIDVDLTGAFIVAKAVAPGMIERGGGKIINICSMMSELGRETVAAYASAKGGLKMLTRNLACEWAEYNIQVNAIGPGYIATPQTAPLRENGHPFNNYILSKTPAGRWGSTDDLKGAAIFLASAASDFVNGHVLYVDGGILAYIGKPPK